MYLGFDLSTQSATAVALDLGFGESPVVGTWSIEFDDALPHYGTSHGVVHGADPLEAFSPPLMWAEAIDQLVGIVARELGPERRQKIAAISGSAQQHGSVYLNARAASHLASLDPRKPLAGQIGDIFSRDLSPIWMDSSTRPQCERLAAAAGGGAALARLTGSRAFERFTGPQIAKFAELEPDRYAATDQIHLVSSFMASLLAQRHAPVDRGDASGTNLMELAAGVWSQRLLAAAAPDLARRLPRIVYSVEVIGTLGRYWQERYGLPPSALVAWSGDNPCSAVGVGVVAPNRRAISLGTSDTIFGLALDPPIDPSGTGHVFGAATGEYLTLTCFKNGSLARERIRDRFGLDWNGFSDVLRRSPPGNRGGVLLPWFEAEITPPVLTAGVRRFGIDEADVAGNVRGVVEGQMLAMARHSRWMGGDVKVLHATGGASANREILQVMADVFNAEVVRLPLENSACLGAALRAWHGYALTQGLGVGLDGPDPTRLQGTVRVLPNPTSVAVYRDLAERHEQCERDALARTVEP